MKKHLAATRIQKIVRGKQVRHHLAIKRLISTLKKDGTPEEDANVISDQLLIHLKVDILIYQTAKYLIKLYKIYSLFCLY